MRTERLRISFFSLLVLLLGFTRFAHAELINFDDLKRMTDPEFPFWADQPITDHYASRGLLIDDGYLNEYAEGSDRLVSGPNYLQGGPYLTFKFVGQPPKFVSLVVTSSNEDAVTLGASCGDGSTLVAETPGWAGPDKDVPFKAKNLVSFSSDHGILMITVSAFYFLRTSAMIDDITYRYSLPEPAPLFLLCLALAALSLRRRYRDGS